MTDLILIDGDLAIFDPLFGLATVAVAPGTLRASGGATLQGKKVCIDGDERSVSVEGCAYTTAAFPVSGVGTLKISGLAINQKGMKTSSNKKKVLLKGGKFMATFQVQTPAQLIPPASPPQQDKTPEYAGTGSFQTFNQKFKGS
jgi:hypothetical protein